MKKSLVFVLILAAAAYGFYYFAQQARNAPTKMLPEDTAIETENPLEEKMDTKQDQVDEPQTESLEEQREEPELAEDVPLETEKDLSEEEPTANTLVATDLSGVDSPTIDETWLSFTSSDGSFSFTYPSRGRYAPTWELSYLSTKDDRVVEDCFYAEGMDPSIRDQFPSAHAGNVCRTGVTTDENVRRDFLLIPRKTPGYILITLEVKQDTRQFVLNEYIAALKELAGTIEIQ